MIDTQRVWLTPDAHARLLAELTALLSPEHGASADGSTGADDDQFPHRHHSRQARIRQIQDLLNNAVVGEDPPDDGVAEPGMVLTVRYDDDEETETFLLGVRGAEHGDIEVYSPQSPLGAALTGARRGEQRTFRVPTGATVRVTLIDAVPYGHAAGTAPAQPPAPRGA